MGSPAVRRTPPGQKNVRELIQRGMTIRTNYDTSGIVTDVYGPDFYDGEQAFTVVYTKPRFWPEPTKHQLYWVNELVAVDGHFLMLLESDKDELFIVDAEPKSEEIIEEAQPKPRPEPKTYIVDAKTYKQACEAYSADLLFEKKPTLRTPFSYAGVLWTTCSRGPGEETRSYQIVPRSSWEGPVKTYAECTQDDNRENPLGMDHGMGASHRGTQYVMVGPPVTFNLASETAEVSQPQGQQLTMF